MKRRRWGISDPELFALKRLLDVNKGDLMRKLIDRLEAERERADENGRKLWIEQQLRKRCQMEFRSLCDHVERYGSLPPSERERRIDERVKKLRRGEVLAGAM